LKGLCTAENLYTINQRAMENPFYDSPVTKNRKKYQRTLQKKKPRTVGYQKHVFLILHVSCP